MPGDYPQLLREVRAAYAALDPGEPVRLRKRTSNLFRIREADAGKGLPVDTFEGVLSIDERARTADVLGMTTYEHLVEATLPHGLAPLVVPQLKTITLGGAVTGLGIESTSFRSGLPHESVLEMDVLTGDGRVLTATPDNEYADLFHGFPNSYGTLGYALRLRIELEPVPPYVRLRHVRFDSAAAAAAALDAIARTGHYQDIKVDYLDGVVASPSAVFLTLGTGVPAAPYVSDYTGRQVFWRSVTERDEDFLTIHDYLWRWDTDWFWCSAALGVQHPLLRPLIPRRYKRSDVYWKVTTAARRTGVAEGWNRLRGRPPRETVVQDIEVPVDRLAEFLADFHEQVGMLPLWLCPLRQRDRRHRWDLYVMDPDITYVNVGFWGTVPSPSGDPSDGTVNRRVERLVTRLDGRKSLYSDAYYAEQEFWRLYGGEEYQRLKAAYDPQGRLLDLYDKCVARR